MLRGLSILIVYLGALIAILLLSFGSPDWPMGWASLGIYIAISLANFFLVDPDLVRERSRLRAGVQRRDMLLASISFLFLFPVALAVAGIDVGRLGSSPPLPLWLRLLALLFFTLGNALGRWAMAANRFFSTFVRIQQDRSHQVVTGGPYRYVRHPGYAGAILAAIAWPLALGSLWALIPACIGAAGFLVRTDLEDRTLRQDLGGYQDYADRVPYRLFPGIW
jgi:protein-S-isoprenylcysteine O-methyltransferase Ste14